MAHPAVAEPAARTMRAFEQAAAELMQALHAAISGGEYQQRLAEAYGEYVRVVQSALAGEDVQQRGAEAYAKYVAALQQALAPPPQRQRSMEAFRRYLRAVRQAWADSDPDTLDPTVVIALAQNTLTAAWTVGGIAASTPGVPPPATPAP
jgi:hypothetical protein